MSARRRGAAVASVCGDRLIVMTETEEELEELRRLLRRLGVELEVRLSSRCG